ncbi:MAG: NIL domain-containing protein [Calothrix sp. C42_A2020_038]|nr:NIL domain-containing protein [Calothrix sp. C42_A2020_038]
MAAPVQTQIRLPGKYHKQPVISRLTSRYGLIFNITAASSPLGASNEGWFNIELSGNPEKLTNSLSYLQVLGVDLVQVEIANQLKPSQVSEILTNSSTIKSNPQKTINYEQIVISHQLDYQYQYQLLQSQNDITQKWYEYLSNTKSGQVTPETEHNQTARLKLKLGILKRYQRQPIISKLVSDFSLTINITSAILPDNACHDGLFELEIWGKLQQIHASLMYLEKLGMPLLIDASQESENESMII